MILANSFATVEKGALSNNPFNKFVMLRDVPVNITKYNYFIAIMVVINRNEVVINGI